MLAALSCGEWYRRQGPHECMHACLPTRLGDCSRATILTATSLEQGGCEAATTASNGWIDVQAGPCGPIRFHKFKRWEDASARSSDIPLLTFDGSPSTTFRFVELNDPVMGGRSSGVWRAGSGFGSMQGVVLDVPSLKAPGFIKAAADGSFPPASAAMGGSLVLEVRSSTPEYKGFRLSFAAGTLSPSYACAGGGSIPLSRGCFKAKFSVPKGDGWSSVRIPFTSFSDKWSPATGEQTTTCAQDLEVCPTAKALDGIKRLEFWAEGADGEVHLDVKSVRASPSASLPLAIRFSTLSSSPPSNFMSCAGPIQPTLRFGISGRTQPTVPVAVDDNETLADAVCCDTRVKPYAEPQFLFEAPDIALFSRLEAGVTTFYDSVCGIPLFRAPVNRTLNEFRADTKEHGWPSFRQAEVVRENVQTDLASGFVSSKCGTHLGTYLPDEHGPR
ncbi:MAG: hypothetical protein SGPRY_012083, partial [Prymnesium sp.]